MKNLILLYLPWLPLGEGMGFDIEIRNSQEDEKGEDDDSVMIYIQTQNFGSIKVLLKVENKTKVLLQISCDEKFPKNIAYICEIYYLCTLFVEMVNMANQKEDILKLAARKMQKVGIRSVSVDDICRELGMSKKTFYVYFASKDALVECILRMGEAEGKKKLENIVKKIKKKYY